MFADLLSSPGVREHGTLRSGVGFLALHGGLEAGTAEIAEAAADRAGASWYAVVQPVDGAWHLPSHHFDPAASSRLRELLDHCDVVVSLHGYGRQGLWTSLLVGGAERSLAARLAVGLRHQLPAYEIVDDMDAIPADLRGLDGRNPVNRTRGGGVQLELPPTVRGIGPRQHGGNDGRLAPDTEALVCALVTFAVDAVR